MRRSKQIRLTRELSSSLLSSSLTEKELIDLCHDILDNGAALNNTALSILNMLEQDSLDNNKLSHYSSEVQNEAMEAYRWLKKKGVNKDKLFIAMSMFHPRLGDFIDNMRPTIREALEYFIDTFSRSDFNHFMKSFNDDEFIRMIEDK
ncbi:hypothetical protein HYN76_22940 [Vibrio parahaemolyticus]|uniref:hypothetical protein n=1 Tax=Vibrio TaxID=662 RepID=UPI000A3D55DC|nr:MULTISPECIES: hypothetical protein [Vibrio]MBM5091842.1 hypothetical protein [Vibrio parahaemolyticus]MBM5184677.1 hypothetical protein [Vibrio parahaemolyticus]MDA0146708.1 hypothetical protein [Vibrio sp. RW]MDF4321558.1 hypothetical protein [Vibrio parahaemolyticus]OUD44788.1 hypothetical protein BS624_14735 [Vibrio parahaemolyticus]